MTLVMNRIHLPACFFALWLSIECVACINGRTSFSSRLIDKSFKEIAGVSFKKCSEECQLRTKCASINYNNKMHFCELNSEKHGTGFPLTTAKGWHYVGMIDPSETDDAKPCSQNICENTEACVNETCIKAECSPKIPTIANGHVLGNMNEVDSKMKMKCDEGHIMDGQDGVTCQADGMWSTVPVCVYNMDCTVGMRYDFASSVCSYRCHGGYTDSFRVYNDRYCSATDSFEEAAPSLDACHELCIRSTGCTAADYNVITSKCCIQTTDNRLCIRFGNGWIYSLRDCA